MTFALHPNFKNKPLVTELGLSTVLLHETKECPWIILVPRLPEISQMTDLTRKDQHLLVDEIDFCSNAMEMLFNPDRLNIGAIGNITAQLHIHLICRYKTDSHWPDVCWNKPLTEMSADDSQERAAQIRQKLS